MQGDRELKERILEELRYEPKIYSTEIGVAVSDQIVTLMGHVSSFAKKRAAEEAVKRLYGVRAIVNEVEVDLPGTCNSSDSKIVHSALAIFESHGLDHILIMINEGVVTLEGEVESQDEKTMAEVYLQNLSGVRTVKNLLSVRNPISDLRIKGSFNFPIAVVETSQFADPLEEGVSFSS